ncbi:hypothetical protein DRO49_03440 [Candidatus Bathyarchaeota archaeon]|nr:MAG: hypothetical protein DRO49_03440 [Candidatus Bathyarchaeota archaeon]
MRVSVEGEEPILRMTIGAFTQMLESLYRIFGSAGLSMIYVMGKERGIYEARRGFTELEGETSIMDVLKLALKRAERLGWGEMEIAELDTINGIVDIRIKKTPFSCRAPDASHCYFYRGYLSGIVSEILGEEMSCTLDKCLLKGDKECVIRIFRTR